jgi:hypothetical protein
MNGSGMLSLRLSCHRLLTLTVVKYLQDSLVYTCIHMAFLVTNGAIQADGKPENSFAFSGEAKNKKYATEIIHECHEAWRRLINGDTPNKTASYELSMYVKCCSLALLRCSWFVSCNLTVQGSAHRVTKDDPLYANLPHDSRKAPAPVDPSSKSTLSGTTETY